jgi:hypothetical protein
MIGQESLLVTEASLIDRLSMPPTLLRRGRGRPEQPLRVQLNPWEVQRSVVVSSAYGIDWSNDTLATA